MVCADSDFARNIVESEKALRILEGMFQFHLPFLKHIRRNLSTPGIEDISDDNLSRLKNAVVRIYNSTELLQKEYLGLLEQYTPRYSPSPFYSEFVLGLEFCSRKALEEIVRRRETSDKLY